GRGDAQEFRRTDLAAQGMLPTQITDAGREAPALQVVTAGITQPDIAVGDRIAQLSREIHAGESAKLHGIGEETDLRRGPRPARLQGRGARLLQEELGRGGILSENGNSGMGRQVEFRIARVDRLAQARADRGDAGLDRFPLRTLEYQGEEALAELPEVPLRLPARTRGGRRRRKPADREAHYLLLHL